MHVNKNSKGDSIQRCANEDGEFAKALRLRLKGSDKRSLFSKWYRPHVKVPGETKGTWTYLSLAGALSAGLV